ncbi:MAG: peptidoglycan-binding protein, partial [Syntrophaceae bacterium]|nr:peptidoglycan-binding protein [Syntrophaceae bacterium]
SGSSVTLSASATPVSPSTISSVQFKIDGSNLGPAVTSSPYSTTWDTTTISDGSHELTASATDDYGNTNTSDAVTVIVDNSVPALQTSLSNMGGHHRDVSNLLASNIPPTSPLSATQTKAFVFIRNLSFGSEGNDVVELQRFLVGQGYLSSDNITGNFRSATKSALQAFQKAQAIVFSGTPSTTGFGNLGALTRAKINTILKGAAPSVPAASATTTQSLQDLVTSLQKQLLGLMSLLIAQLRK